MASDRAIFTGVDVGGRRKGFHVAAVEGRRLVAGPRQLRKVDEVLAWIEEIRPRAVGLDSPMTCAPVGEASRTGERALAKEVCGIRWTPEEGRLAGNPYYEWIVHGRELYAALEAGKSRGGWRAVEVFPTASWTIWAGPRGKRRRAGWTREALDDLELEGLPSRRLNQDDRDSIAAALTVQLNGQGRTRSFGEIIVPANAHI
jgi:hypothetical protein